MPLSNQVTSPVSWISWERRFLPEGTGTAEEFCASCLVDACGDAGFSRTSWAASRTGKVTATMANAGRSAIFLMGRQASEGAIPRRVWAHLHCYQMPGEGASVAPEGGKRNRSDSLTDARADGKLTKCRGVARGEV